MKVNINIVILWIILGSFIIIPHQKLMAQSGIECLGCGGMNGKHNTGCKYMSSSTSSKSSVKSSSFEQEIMGAIFSNMLNSVFNSSSNSKETEAEKLKRQQDEQIRQQRLAALIALQKKRNDSIAQAKHNKMMSEYKKLDSGGELKYKGLDDNKWKASIHFNCKITSFKGEVTVMKSVDGKLHAKQLTADQPIDLSPGDWIKTGPNSSIKLHYGLEKGGEDVMLGQNSAMNIVTDENGTNIPKIQRGNVYITNNLVSEKAAEITEDIISEANKEISKLRKKLKVRVHGGTCSIRGTEFSIEVDSLGNSIFNVFEGVVEIVDDNEIFKLTLTANQKGIISNSGNLLGPIPIKANEIIKWWKEK
ncbi:FecR family protein [Flavobacterium lacisediminis]|uniref:FecR family protein n=1 Tax=Flavobacterium lacisediminis TaxID=2989705 RepID=A0ABT3EKX1_9FLAO|nr:FecR family protein [Flavobacterium lacisediminis]MCW1149226.1 FecR family protein [Flavobacterium lacisediminis]